MQTLNAHAAFRRGLQLFAGMLCGHKTEHDQSHDATSSTRDLVSWCSEARTRREDELARSRQLEGLPERTG